MIAAWMLYCVTLGVLLAGAGLLSERVVQEMGGATRRVWALAMAAAVLVPVAGIVVRDGDLPEEALFGGGAAISPLLVMMVDGIDLLSVLDGLLVTAWIVASCVVGAGALLALQATRRRLSRCARGRVEGIDVLVSPEMGPAVVGFVKGRVVLPRWALEVRGEERAMIVRHELEHLAGRDPQLLLFALLLVLTMPWNVPLWYMARRLRLAVEVDCDRRVLAHGATDVRAYGTLLVSVGRRRSASAYPVAAFSRPRSLLEHRIDRMTAAPVRGAGIRALATAALVAGVLALVWCVPQPVRAADTSGWFEPCPEEYAPPQQPHVRTDPLRS